MNPKPGEKITDNWSRHPMPQRHSMAQHSTVSGVVLFQGHVLLIHHKRIGAWLPPGGHVEELELPHEAVVREVFEETGVAVEVLSPHLPDTNDPNAFLLPTPLCMHAVHAVEKGIGCYHVDIVFLCAPRDFDSGVVDGKSNGDLKFPPLLENEEVHGSAWIALDRLAELPLAKNVVEVLALARSVSRL